MIIKLLGEQMTLYRCIEHIPVHHNNEIAQSELPLVWNFSRNLASPSSLTDQRGKDCKSEGNVVYLAEIMEKGFSPLLPLLFIKFSIRLLLTLLGEGLVSSAECAGNFRVATSLLRVA